MTLNPSSRSGLPFNPVLAHLPVYQPGRPIQEVARALGLRPESIIKLASNENPLGPSPRAIEAMRGAIALQHLYPDGNAFYLKRELAAKLGVETAHIVLGNGSNEIIELVGHALIEPDCEVVVSQFCFAVYPIVTHLFGGKLVVVPARGYGHDLEAMARSITSRTRVIFVANPNNPTGTLATNDDVTALLKAVPPHALLVMDEAYLDFLENPLDLLPLIREGTRKNLLLLRTFSKIYGLAGVRIGYGVGDVQLIDALDRIRQPFNINAMAQAAAQAALSDDDHVRRTRENNRVGQRFFESAFRKLRLEFVPSFANFILVRVGEGERVFSELQRQGVIVRPMGGYQLPEWIRISIGTPAENERCLAGLAEVLKSQARAVQV